jgi:small GTP-binding protein
MKSATPGRAKIVFIGDTQVGKTSLINRFVTGNFTDLVYTTVAGRGQSREINTKEGPVIMDIWDTAGQEQYRSLTSLFFRNAAAIVLVYDISKLASFESIQSWLDYSHKQSDGKALYFLVGNKSDLDDSRAVPLDRALSFVDQMGLQVAVECSAKTGAGVEDFFEVVASNPGLNTANTPVATLVRKKSCCSN